MDTHEQTLAHKCRLPRAEWLRNIRRKTSAASHRARYHAVDDFEEAFRSTQLSRLSRRLSPMLTLAAKLAPSTSRPSTPEPAETSETCPACHLMSEHAEGCELDD